MIDKGVLYVAQISSKFMDTDTDHITFHKPHGHDEVGVKAYFDGSGYAGVVCSVEDWEVFASAILPDGVQEHFPLLSDLIKYKTCGELDDLAIELHFISDPEGKSLLSIVEGRAENDGSLTITVGK